MRFPFDAFHEIPAGAGRAARGVAAGLLDLLYPPLCLGCGRAGREATPLCPRCLARLDRAEPAEVAARLASWPVPFRCAAVGWRFQRHGGLRRAHHGLKFGERPEWGERLGLHLAVLVGAACAPARGTLVVPMPLHRVRALERGYNQSTSLARGLAQGLGLPLAPGALRRVRPTRSQVGLGRDARWRNVARAFEADAVAARGGHVMLVDDVLTTGATAAAAAQALLDAGAASVSFAALGLAA